MRRYIAIYFSIILLASIGVPSIAHMVGDEMNIGFFNSPEEEENQTAYERIIREHFSEYALSTYIWDNSKDDSKIRTLDFIKVQKGFFDHITPPPKAV
ncbi:MAG: hypothetical protein CMH48_05065 [Muricauda sp.]|jgi:hypothetical protein|nr:hypothetical protein [Allomuricauda sp.]MBC30199.1 hypothetical protein [Allomuricauda sp.]|tara:strand:- start:495 stop:788 length:294 start_codon:yes stop_codon:yes gene_type:complete